MCPWNSLGRNNGLAAYCVTCVCVYEKFSKGLNFFLYKMTLEGFFFFFLKKISVQSVTLTFAIYKIHSCEYSVSKPVGFCSFCFVHFVICENMLTFLLQTLRGNKV